MGKRIIPRARGKGSQRYRSPSFRYLGRIEYSPVSGIHAVVKDIVHDPGHSAPVAIIKLENGKEILHIASEGLRVGDAIDYGGNVSVGNVLPLGNVPEGTKVFCIETFPRSGPKLCRSSGVAAFVIGRSGDKVKIQFPSGKIIEMNANCRATVGVPAAGGRVDKPWLKAGKHAHAMYAHSSRVYPRSRGVSMTPADHPYGGRSKRPRTSKGVSRNAPPGAKVGSIAASRFGKRKGK